MKKKILVITIVLLMVVGCGNVKDSDKTSSSDLNSSEIILFPREQKDFEKYTDYVVATREDTNYSYELKIYFKNDKVVNSVWKIVCSNNDDAQIVYNGLYNNVNIQDAVINGNTIEYDYKAGKSDYYNFTLKDIYNTLVPQKYDISYNSDVLSSTKNEG